MKLRTKLLVVIYFLVTLPTVFMMLVAISQAQLQSADTTRNHLTSLASIEKNSISNILNDYYNRFVGITSRTKFRSLLAEYKQTGDPDLLPAVKKILLDAMEPFDDLANGYLYSADGSLLIEIGTPNETADVRNLFGYQKNFAYSEFDNHILVRGSIQLEGNELGALILGFTEDAILESVQNYRGLGDTGEILVGYKNDFGEAVFIHDRRFDDDDRASRVVSMTSIDAPIVQALLGNEDVFFDFKDYRGQPVVAATRYLDRSDWGLVVKMDQEELQRGVSDFTLFLLVIFVIIFIFVCMISFVLTRFMVKPITILTDIARSISDGKLNARFPKSITLKSDETGLLARTMREMLRNIREASRRLEQRVADRTKELRKAKRKSELHAKELEKYKLAMDRTSDQIVMTDVDGIVVYANEAVARFTGFSLSEVLGTKAGKLWGGLMSKAYYRKMWKTIKTDKQVFTSEIKQKRKDNQIGENYVSIAPLLNDSGEVEFFIAVYRDITKEKNIDRMKTEFISLASHQLRTPLAAINWLSELLIDGDYGKLRPKQKDQIQDIHASSIRMTELVNALLNISRIESGRIIIDPQPTNLNDLVGTVLHELRPEIDAKKHKCILSTNNSIGDVNVDPKLLHEVYKNFISNAIKYTPEGGDIFIFISENEKGIISQISDNGYGIPKSQQNNIFKKFFRAGNIQELDTDGTGLGLYLVKSIIESSGGEVWFRSKENEGTSFFFSLPKKGMRKKRGEVRLS